MCILENTEKDKWFALGAPYRNESRVCAELEKNGVQTWIPTVKIKTEVHGQKKWTTKPAIGNLFFAHTTEKRLLNLKPFIPRLQFKITTEGGVNKKVTVPEDELENFRKFVEQLSSVPEFVSPEKLNLKEGAKVKVISGAMEGVEGTFIKVKGHRGKMLCISLGPLGSTMVEIASDSVRAL